MTIEYNASKIADEVLKNMNQSIKVYQQRYEVKTKQKQKEQELKKQEQEQEQEQKYEKKEKHKKTQEAIDKRQSAWLEKRKNQIESQIPANKEETLSPAKTTSASNNNIKEEVLRLIKQSEIIKQKNREEKEIVEKLKQQQEKDLKQLKLKEKTRQVSTIKNVDYYYQLRTPKREVIKSYEEHTISSDPRQTVITRIKVEGLGGKLQKNQQLNSKNQAENKENYPIDKNIKSCLKNSSKNKNQLETAKLETANLNQKSSNKKGLEKTIEIHLQNLENAKIAYNKCQFTKLRNKNGKINEAVEGPLNKISTPRTNYTDILKAFANTLKKSDNQISFR